MFKCILGTEHSFMCLKTLLSISKSGLAETQTERLGLSKQGYYFPEKLLEMHLGSNYSVW